MMDILVRPQELRLTAEQLRAAAQKIGKSLETIDGQIRSLKGESFLGNRADVLQSHYVAKREALSRARDLVLSFATDLETAATVFQNADSANSPTHLPVSGGEFWDKIGILPFLPLGPRRWMPDIILGPGTWTPHIRFPELPIWFLKIGENTETPEWIRKLFDRLFPDPGSDPQRLISPRPLDMQPNSPPTTGLGELLKQSPVTTPAEPAPQPIAEPATPQPIAEPATPQPDIPSQTLDYSYDVPVKAQGDLYGNAACAPTSVSMVLDYYHNQNGTNQVVSADQLIGMMDKGDGVSGRGISLSNLTDELNDIGYHNISQKVGANFTDLRSAVQDGPVIVIAGVKIGGFGTVGGDGPRTLTGPGNTIHAMVVTGLSDQQVHVNDPWTGQGLDLPREQFEKMWTRGSSSYYSIRP